MGRSAGSRRRSRSASATRSLGLALAFVLAAAISGGWSLLIGRVVVEPLHARHRLGQPILIATAAVALSVQEFLRISQGARERWTPPVFNQPIALARAEDFIVTVTPMQIVVAMLGLAAAGGVLVLLGRTRFGRAWRAFADDPGTAALFGVDGKRLLASTFLLAGPAWRASPVGSSPPITATSRSRWARCSG